MTHHFESVAAELIDSASTEKARAFAQKIVDAARAKGDEWLEANKFELMISISAEDCEKGFPIRDNRAVILSKFQLLLNK